jgi:hypothetical protein
MDMVLVLLGGTTLWLAVESLSFSDPRWLYNAWTYVIGIPLGLVAVDLLLRSVVSRFVERTMQVAFLLSMLMHLLLTLGGVHLVVLSRGPEQLANTLAAASLRQERLSSSIPEYVQQAEEANLIKPDYLRPAATDDAEASQAELEKQATELPATVPAPADVPDTVVEAAPAEVVKREELMAEPELPSEPPAAELPDRARPSLDPPALVAIPGNPTPLPAESLPILEPAAVPLAASSATRVRAALENFPVDELQANPLLAVREPAPARRQPWVPPPTDVALGEPGMVDFTKPFSPSVPAARIPNRIPVPAAGDGAAAGTSDRLPSQDLVAAETAASRLSSNRSSSRNFSGQVLRGLPLGDEALSPAVDIDRTKTRSPIVLGGRKGAVPDLEVALALPGSPGPTTVPRLPSPRPTPNAPAVAVPTPAFQQRMTRNDGSMEPAELGEFGPATEAAIERGLEFLARSQRADGSWRLEDFEDFPRLRSHTAATGLALLSFQGAGYSHRQYQYATVCQSALAYLLAHQRADGDLYLAMDESSDANIRFYSHSIAALALCEAFGMTQDESLREPAQRAVQFMVASQDPRGGGWRYQPGIESDTSVSGWFMMALKSAELAGLRVPAKTFEGIVHWLDLAQVAPDQRHLYRYNPFAEDNPVTGHGRVANPTMTAVGLLMRLYLGWRRDHPDMIRGADHLLGHLPVEGTARNPQRDTYYWYYATQVLFHMGGERWKQWNNQLHPLLIESQLREGRMAGSWDPMFPVADRWGPFAGRLYVTTLNLLSLEVYYRHLPIYEETAR